MQPVVRVLVVDDEREVREVVRRALELNGFTATAAPCADDALAALERAPFDVLLSDIRMAGMDGLELLAQVKSRWPGVVFLLMTGVASLDAALEALHLGADDFIPKPATPDQLVLAIRRALARRETERRLAVLERLNEAKQDFINLMSHELATPLTSLRGALELLADDAAQLDEDLQEVLQIAGSSVEQLGRMIEDLSLLYRLRQGARVRRAAPVDPTALARAAVERIAARHPDRPVQLSDELGGRPRELDSELIERALIHLLDNACKFSPAGLPVELALRPAPDGWSIEVSDQGPGIPPASRSIVFEPFVKLAGAGTDLNRGPGLGLPIARAIAELHGGTLELDCPPHGCRLALRLHE